MTDGSDEARVATKPPYISFKTLANLWDRLAAEGFPARIDKSYLQSTAGGYATVVIASLRWLGHLHEDGRPTQALRELVDGDESQRKAHVALLLRTHYDGLEEAARANQTQQQFLEYFTSEWGLVGDTRRKAVAFYLGAAKWAGVQIGSLWKTPPSGSPSPRRSNAGKTAKADSGVGEVPSPRVEPDPLVDKLSTALRGVLERLPTFGDAWTSRERDMFKRSFDNVLEWDYPVSDATTSGSDDD